MLRGKRHHAGFTLVELAVVVVIVGILAVVGFEGYRRHQATVRTTEAQQVTAGLRTAQAAFKAERGTYATISNGPTEYYPAAVPGAYTTQWGGPCTNCVDGADGWHKLPFAPSGPVMYGYATVAGVGASTLGALAPPAINGTPAVDFTGAAAAIGATDPWYVTVANGDTDGDGIPCIVLSYSVSNQIVVKSAGE